MDKLRIVGLGGSLRPQSTSLAALKITLEAMEEMEVETELLDIRSLNLPMFVPGIKGIPESVKKLNHSTYQAHGMIWSTPLYHGSMSGSFKNALDWLNLLADRDPPYLTDKVIGLISTAGGAQGLQAINSMEFTVRALRAWAVPLVVPIAQAWKTFDKDGQTSDEKLEMQLGNLGREVVRAAKQFATDGFCDYSVPYIEEIAQD